MCFVANKVILLAVGIFKPTGHQPSRYIARVLVVHHWTWFTCVFLQEYLYSAESYVSGAFSKCAPA